MVERSAGVRGERSLERGERTLILDANLDKRIATELRARGRPAHGLAELRLADQTDPDLLRELSERFRDPWILITADDSMPSDHDFVIATLTVTIATIDPRYPPKYDPASWCRDVVHRWAHAMQVQVKGSVMRYSIGGRREWTRRKRPQ